jgi:diguanylate cyclase (GGDEF)-like protein
MKLSNQQQADFPKSYEETLIATTRHGIMLGCGFFAFFTIFYWLDGYPIQTVWLNLAALLIALASLAFMTWRQNNKLAAQLILIATYVSLVGPALYTGGLLSTNMIWLVFIPLEATIMLGRRATALWGGISLATTVAFFMLNVVLKIDLTLRPPQVNDHLVDLLSVTIVMVIAAMLNETIKLRYMKDLEAIQQTLHRQARLDPLTQSNNRRFLAELAGPHLSVHSNSLLMLDIDHFKEINDTHGHTVGDQVLQWFSERCRMKLRQGDILARMGGDEFVIFLPNTDMTEAGKIADRICDEIASSKISTPQGEIQLTTSIGVASNIPDDHTGLEALITHADHALYKSKQNGRNQVSLSNWKERLN